MNFADIIKKHEALLKGSILMHEVNSDPEKATMRAEENPSAEIEKVESVLRDLFSINTSEGGLPATMGQPVQGTDVGMRSRKLDRLRKNVFPENVAHKPEKSGTDPYKSSMTENESKWSTIEIEALLNDIGEFYRERSMVTHPAESEDYFNEIRRLRRNMSLIQNDIDVLYRAKDTGVLPPGWVSWKERGIHALDAKKDAIKNIETEIRKLESMPRSSMNDKEKKESDIQIAAAKESLKEAQKELDEAQSKNSATGTSNPSATNAPVPKDNEHHGIALKIQKVIEKELGLGQTEAEAKAKRLADKVMEIKGKVTADQFKNHSNEEVDHVSTRLADRTLELLSEGKDKPTGKHTPLLDSVLETPPQEKLTDPELREFDEYARVYERAPVLLEAMPEDVKKAFLLDTGWMTNNAVEEENRKLVLSFLSRANALKLLFETLSNKVIPDATYGALRKGFVNASPGFAGYAEVLGKWVRSVCSALGLPKAIEERALETMHPWLTLSGPYLSGISDSVFRIVGYSTLRAARDKSMPVPTINFRASDNDLVDPVIDSMRKSHPGVENSVLIGMLDKAQEEAHSVCRKMESVVNSTLNKSGIEEGLTNSDLLDRSKGMSDQWFSPSRIPIGKESSITNRLIAVQYLKGVEDKLREYSVRRPLGDRVFSELREIRNEVLTSGYDSNLPGKIRKRIGSLLATDHASDRKMTAVFDVLKNVYRKLLKPEETHTDKLDSLLVDTLADQKRLSGRLQQLEDKAATDTGASIGLPHSLSFMSTAHRRQLHNLSVEDKKLEKEPLDLYPAEKAHKVAVNYVARFQKRDKKIDEAHDGDMELLWKELAHFAYGFDENFRRFKEGVQHLAENTTDTAKNYKAPGKTALIRELREGLRDKMNDMVKEASSEASSLGISVSEAVRRILDNIRFEVATKFSSIPSGKSVTGIAEELRAKGYFVKAENVLREDPSDKTYYTLRKNFADHIRSEYQFKEHDAFAIAVTILDDMYDWLGKRTPMSQAYAGGEESSYIDDDTHKLLKDKVAELDRVAGGGTMSGTDAALLGSALENVSNSGDSVAAPDSKALKAMHSSPSIKASLSLLEKLATNPGDLADTHRLSYEDKDEKLRSELSDRLDAQQAAAEKELKDAEKEFENAQESNSKSGAMLRAEMDAYSNELSKARAALPDNKALSSSVLKIVKDLTFPVSYWLASAGAMASTADGKRQLLDQLSGRAPAVAAPGSDRADTLASVQKMIGKLKGIFDKTRPGRTLSAAETEAWNAAEDSLLSSGGANIVYLVQGRYPSTELGQLKDQLMGLTVGARSAEGRLLKAKENLRDLTKNRKSILKTMIQEETQGGAPLGFSWSKKKIKKAKDSEYVKMLKDNEDEIFGSAKDIIDDLSQTIDDMSNASNSSGMSKEAYLVVNRALAPWYTSQGKNVMPKAAERVRVYAEEKFKYSKAADYSSSRSKKELHGAMSPQAKGAVKTFQKSLMEAIRNGTVEEFLTDPDSSYAGVQMPEVLALITKLQVEDGMTTSQAAGAVSHLLDPDGIDAKYITSPTAFKLEKSRDGLRDFLKKNTESLISLSKHEGGLNQVKAPVTPANSHFIENSEEKIGGSKDQISKRVFGTGDLQERFFSYRANPHVSKTAEPTAWFDRVSELRQAFKRLMASGHLPGVKKAEEYRSKTGIYSEDRDLMNGNVLVISQILSDLGYIENNIKENKVFKLVKKVLPEGEHGIGTKKPDKAEDVESQAFVDALEAAKVTDDDFLSLFVDLDHILKIDKVYERIVGQLGRIVNSTLSSEYNSITKSEESVIRNMAVKSKLDQKERANEQSR